MADKRQVQDIQRQLIQLTAAFCQAHLGAEYDSLCQKLIGKKLPANARCRSCRGVLRSGY